MYRTFTALAVCLSLVGKLPSLAADAAEGAKPNILHIHADDHRPDGLHALGTQVLQTPNLDTLVLRGTTFTRAYTQGSMIGAVCTPSRTMMLTGRSWQRIPGAPGAAVNAGDAATFLPRVLAAAGYQTWHMGKRGNSFLAGINAFQTNHTDEGGRAASSRRLADKTIEFLQTRSASKEARPFYIYLAPPVPHDPRVAEPRFHKLYDPARLSLSPAFLPQHPFDNGEMTVRDEKLAPWPRTPENTRKQLADYYACISGLDHHVGRIFDELKKLGLWDNTLVVFSGDNGLSLGEHGLFGKQNLYEYGGMHVPLVFAGPGIPRGKSDALVYLMDLFPTFADYAGAKLPDGVEGQSLRPVIEGTKAKIRDVLYTGYRDCMRSIRDDRWKLIRYPLVDRTQLFDLQNDPRELKNLADKPEHAAKVADLTRLLQKEMARYGDKHPLRIPNPRPAEWSPSRARLTGTKPNIVFILTDDQGYGDLSAHGNSVLKTPNLDRLHAESVRFTDFHVSPTCSPSRSALMTGRHEFKNGVTHTILERERLAPEATTIAAVLKSAGYATGIFGKWHLGDEPDRWPSKRGFDEMFIHGGGGIGQTYPGSCGDAPGNTYFNPFILHNGQFEKTHGYCTDVFFAQATKWIEAVRGKQPFFCYIPTNAPHAPLQVRPEDEARYKDKVKEPAVAKFFGMIANIDDNVGRLVAKLKEWGLEKNTLVVFMNDNGGTVGVRIFNAGMRGQKVTPWLGGTRAMSLWRWPGTLTPAACDRLAAHIDFFPTIAELAGAKLSDSVKKQVEGRSLVPLLADPQAPWPDRILFTHVGRWPKGAKVDDHKYHGCSVRSTSWHLVSVGNAAPRWQLYDVAADPGEKSDVADKHPELVKRLNAEYDQWWSSLPPYLVNEGAVGPKENPFKVLFRKQLGSTGN